MASQDYEGRTLKDLVLDQLRQSDKPMGPSQLAEAVGTSPNSVSQTLRELLLERKISKKGRGNYVLLEGGPAPFVQHAGRMSRGKSQRNNGGARKDEARAHKESDVMSYPFLEAGPAAGAAGVQWNEGERITVPTSVAAAWANGRRVAESRAYWTRVQGSSMEPWLPDQSPIFVERAEGVVDSGRYVIWLDDVDGEIVKRVERLGGGYIRIISDNPNHATQTLRHLEDDLYEDVDRGSKVRIRIRGRVLYPPDTPHAILRTVTEQMAKMLGPR